MQSTETYNRNLYVYELIIKCYPNFITCLYSPFTLIRWDSTHCHLLYLMELFKRKENFMEKVDSNNNWKTAWPRMILGWHLFLRLSCIRICKKNVEFCGKTSKFLPKRCQFIFCIFLFKWREAKPVCLTTYVENEISNSASNTWKRRERERGTKT